MLTKSALIKFIDDQAKKQQDITIQVNKATWESLWSKPEPVNNFITEQMIRDNAYKSIDRPQAKSSHSTGYYYGLPVSYFRTQMQIEIHNPHAVSNHAPITVTRPVTSDGQTDSSDLAGLITTTHIRTSKANVGTLIDASNQLNEYVASNHARTSRETDLFDCIAFPWIFSPQPDIKKENQMSTINLSTLVALAQPTHSDEFTQKATSIAPGKLGDKIQYLLQRKEDEKMDAAAETIVNLIKLSDDNITESVARIRAARQLIAAEKTKIEQIEMACAFGSATMNYIPLLKATSCNHMSQEAKVVDLAKIPEYFEKMYKDSKAKAKEAADASNKKVTAKKTPK